MWPPLSILYDEKKMGLRLPREELKTLRELELVCYPRQEAYTIEMLRDFLAYPTALIVRQFAADGRLVGFQMSNVEAEELITVDVHPDFRRRGLGRKILQTTLSEFRNRGATRAFCEIRTDNEASLRLHWELGFVTLGRIPRYYPSGADAFMLGAKL
ncbi:MAG: GNAT family N-acetyltransferase [bacterium]